MTTTEKLNYIIQVINEILNDSKTIGDLPDHTLEEGSSVTTFVGLFNSVLNKSEKISIADLLTYAASIAVEEHTHEIVDIQNLGAAINQVYIDTNDSKWRVQRFEADYDFTKLLAGDQIAGFKDANTWITGIVLDPTIDVTADADINNTDKFFIITKKIKLS